MPLFDSKLRNDPSESSGNESTFAFLDRVASPFFEHVRQALNRWLSAYPEHERQDLINRMRKESDDFRDAFWELWLYTAYRGAGFEIEVHPEVPGLTRKPDFAISRGDFSAYLEARVATGVSAQARGRERLLETFYEDFNAGDHRDFRLALSIIDEGVAQPKAKGMRQAVMTWLDGEDVEDVARAGEPYPSRSFSSNGWTFRFTALPLAPDRRGRSRAPLLSIYPGGSFAGDAGAAFRNALERKGRKYGHTEKPIIVAILLEELWAHDEDVEVALYGGMNQLATLIDGQIVTGESWRRDDGYWTATSGRRVAAVLTARQVQPWMALRPRPQLWINPFAPGPVEHPPVWPRIELSRDGQIQVTAAREGHLAEWLGVPHDWPPGVPFGH